ncbi:calmodulin-A-like isoform X2 [Bolinopsis microptera]|uniref:calmodulin-A-like isoform X2 n=1 Tax=Bolinopsis microptera TaxID=2820187 RepID=UPI00307A9FB8
MRGGGSNNENKISDFQVNMFRDIFNMYDKDGNNTIDCSELKLILEELGYECSTEEVLQVISKFDLNTTGTIDFNEFLSLIGDWMSNDENQIRDAFEVFDKEGNGYLSLEQLKRALTTYGEAFTDNEAEEFFKEIDVDGDGTITADEFIQYIKGVNS